MDDSGLKLRKNKSIDISDIINHLTPSEKNKYIDFSSSKPKLKNDLSKAEKQQLQDLVFSRLSYDDKLKYCLRPEETQITNINK